MPLDSVFCSLLHWHPGLLSCSITFFLDSPSPSCLRPAPLSPSFWSPCQWCSTQCHTSFTFSQYVTNKFSPSFPSLPAEGFNICHLRYLNIRYLLFPTYLKDLPQTFALEYISLLLITRDWPELMIWASSSEKKFPLNNVFGFFFWSYLFIVKTNS